MHSLPPFLDPLHNLKIRKGNFHNQLQDLRHQHEQLPEGFGDLLHKRCRTSPGRERRLSPAPPPNRLSPLLPRNPHGAFVRLACCAPCLGLLLVCTTWRIGFDPGFRFCAGGGRSSAEAWYSTALDIEEVLSVICISLLLMSSSHLRLLIGVSWVWFSAVWDCRPGSVHAHFEYHAHVWLRF